MLVGFGRVIKTRGKTLSVMGHVKRSIVKVKAEENCIAHVLIILIAKVDDANYTSYRKGNKICSVVKTSLQRTGMNPTNSAGISETIRLPEHFRDYKIVA